ncbi:CAP domain-containing protein [Solimonas sp. SE-A11]|uniref:CAP domain-containing protein n=1 Tax=Solimonas sp. SE-A11 TaxID=3054954 RepID=UPI00259CA16F|nr:CAP domain-containing protein [Solimonas sp. SE-A11]MDM4768870.1 CAP domain-containing protein [Solimonas sp. SE-A11]
MKTRLIAALMLALGSLLPGVLQAQGEPPGFEGMLGAHNGIRGAVNQPPLRWSAQAAAQAQSWADQLARENCAARYNPDMTRREKYGENVFRATAGQPYQGYRRTPAQVVSRWNEEGRDYDHNLHQCRNQGGTQCGQYLQMIWGATEEVGCGRARCETAEVWVCNYTPRGLQDGVKPYGNPPAPPAVSEKPQEVMVGALECSALPQVYPGVDYPQQSPVN